MGAVFRDNLNDLSLAATLIHLPQVGELGPLGSRGYFLKVQVGHLEWRCAFRHEAFKETLGIGRR